MVHNAPICLELRSLALSKLGYTFVAGELKPIRIALASRGFLAATRLSSHIYAIAKWKTD